MRVEAGAVYVALVSTDKILNLHFYKENAMTSMPPPPLLPSLHVLSASTLDTEMKRDHDDSEGAAVLSPERVAAAKAFVSPELVAAAKAFVVAAKAHIEASMGNDRQVPRGFWDHFNRGREDPRVYETRAALNDAYLAFQNVWIQNSIELLGEEHYAEMKDELGESTPEICLLYAVHFANVKDTPSGADVDRVAQSMLQSIAALLGYMPEFYFAGVLSFVKPVGEGVEQVRRAMKLSAIAKEKIRETRARVFKELPPSSVAAADVVRDLTLPPPVDYWYAELGKWDFRFKKM